MRDLTRRGAITGAATTLAGSVAMVRRRQAQRHRSDATSKRPANGTRRRGISGLSTPRNSCGVSGIQSSRIGRGKDLRFEIALSLSAAKPCANLVLRGPMRLAPAFVSVGHPDGQQRSVMLAAEDVAVTNTVPEDLSLEIVNLMASAGTNSK